MTKDEIRARLTKAAASISEPRALAQVAATFEEVAAILAEQQAQIEALKPKAIMPAQCCDCRTPIPWGDICEKCVAKREEKNPGWNDAAIVPRSKP